jgi:hypothetical protein
MEDDRLQAVPRGDAYFSLVSGIEGECEAATAGYLPRAGQKAPQTWVGLGTSLALLDALSSCWWGCAGGDHAVEYLLGRVVGSVRAALRLARAGLYDEALNALRTGMEIVNLLTLFSVDTELLQRWSSAPPRERFALARPTQVMKRLTELGRSGSSMDAEKYDLLSRIAHGNTDDAPQAHNAVGLPLTAGSFQEAGLLVILNEAALTVALATLAGTQLIEIDGAIRRHVLGEARALVLNTGAITVTSVAEALADLRGALSVRPRDPESTDVA